MPKHGEERNRSIKVTKRTIELDGEMYEYVSSENTVVERYCDNCKRWIVCDSVLNLHHMMCKDCLADW